MVNILSLVPYKIFPADVGGQKAIAQFNEHLAMETQLICITVRDNDPKFARGYRMLNIISSGRSRYINLLYFFTFKKLIRKEEITHLVLEHPYYGWLGILLKKFTGVKLVIHSHNIESQRWRSLKKWWWKILDIYEMYTHRYADYNFFIQEDDKSYAVQTYNLKERKCTAVTYGITWNQPPRAEEVAEAKSKIRQLYQISPDETILLFNGNFHYSPNLDGLHKIVHTIHPLLKQKDFRYRIIIAGKGIPPELNNYPDKQIIMAGFVNDITVYFQAADVFLNPVIEGGGIKTKLVEALGHNINTVSTMNGAIGVNPQLCDGKLLISEDGNWEMFAELVIRASKIQKDIPPAYFDHFYLANIVKKAVAFIQT